MPDFSRHHDEHRIFPDGVASAKGKRPRWLSGVLCLAVVCLWGLAGRAGVSGASEGLPDNASMESAETEYYTIEESPGRPPLGASELSSFVPEELFSGAEVFNAVRAGVLNLLQWTLHPQPPPMPSERYHRTWHFGRWINDPTDETCYNTRTKVLIRDSEGPVSFKERNHCLVESGDWQDPYAGMELRSSREIQIDHMVPLKNAYLAGAWQWNYQTRCTYANFLGNRFHLISASGRENMRKGDRGPDGYLPPNESYHCEYLENWLKVKLIWGLNMTPSEIQAIREDVRQSGCNPKNFRLSTAELAAQRELIREGSEACPSR